MSAAKEWFAIDVLVEPHAIEAVESAFNNLDCLGTETDTWKRRDDESIRVSAFFSSPPDTARIENGLRAALRAYGLAAGSIQELSYRQIEDSDWLAEWKKHWKPVEVGTFVIAPPWAEVAKTDKHTIRIEPNMAFGTGTHETTQLCLKALSEITQPGDSFLDVGTGTGILGIAAAKLCAEPVAACDTDADSIAIARENAEVNGVCEMITFFHGTINDATPAFDVVCANLTLDVIVALLPLLITKARRSLILSGILADQQGEITAHLAKFDISNFKFEIAGEWLCVLIDKRRQGSEP
jgi:ribosomal protein L11 methyltransferase